MRIELLRELLQHKRYCHGAMADLQKYAMQDTGPKERAQERYEEAHRWVQTVVERALREDGAA